MPYQANTLCRRVVGELTYLGNLRAGKPQGWKSPYPSFWKSVAQMALPWRPGMHYDDVWLSHPRPGIAGIANWFRTRMKSKPVLVQADVFEVHLDGTDEPRDANRFQMQVCRRR